MRKILFCALFIVLIAVSASAKSVRHYVFFGMDREKLKDATAFLEIQDFEGAQIANFMPGEWLPSEDKGYLRAVYDAARKLKVGVGGPDLLPYKQAQMDNSYPMIRSISSQVAVGLAVQDGDYNHVNPRTKKEVSIAEIIDFGKEYLGVDYIFWCTEEPFYSERLIGFMKARR